MERPWLAREIASRSAATERRGAAGEGEQQAINGTPAVQPRLMERKQIGEALQAGQSGQASGLAADAPIAVAVRDRAPSAPAAAAAPPSGIVIVPTPGAPALARSRESAAPLRKSDEALAQAIRGLAEADAQRAAGRDQMAELADADRFGRGLDRERYEARPENRFQAAAEQPLSTFSIDVDTASYANVRRFLATGRLPPREAVRIEELVNYFPYDYPQPKSDVPFAVALEAAECPWRPGHRLVRIGLQGRTVDRQERPAGNLVFLIDVSGSMSAADKLPLVKQGLAMLVDQLTENDRVAIVTYAGAAGIVLPSTSGDQKETIRAAIDGLSTGGSTHGSAGIVLAYEQADAHFIPGGVNRVLLATDGDLNVGVTGDEALVQLVTEKAKGGTFLTVLGFGTGNLQDAKLEKIADRGNGIYAYIDGAREAHKVLVEQLAGSTITIAKDVKIQVEFNPAQVVSYRLLGYENRLLAARDFRDDKKDAGEIGAGHRVTALYEVELAGDAAAAGAEPLKYQRAAEPRPAPVAVDPAVSRELLTVKLRWKQPEGETSTLLEVPLSDCGGAFEAASADFRHAAAVAAFGMILADGQGRGDATLAMVARTAVGALGSDPGGYRAEFLDLVRRAESLAR
jgi:Ca-activated chloride channel family protein